MFKIDYADLTILGAHLKVVQQRAVVTPHNRPQGKALELLLCSILKGLSQRIDIKLYDYKANVRVVLKRQEMLAFHCAYKYGWLPSGGAGQEIFETIDKVI
ncbi:MAG: hypothetical protein JNK73_13055 [Bacteroidia bacterium]|nr:hypothetical protein [Bacteroidia bacterium]